MLTLQSRVSDDGRHCGSCTACCTHLPIPGGMVGRDAKPAGIPCIHAGALGCRKYSRRPGWCASFQCEWLRNSTWNDAWRPDRAGLLCLRQSRDGRAPTATVFEIRDGALLLPQAACICDALLRTTAGVAIVDATGQHQRLAGLWAPAKTESPDSGLISAQPAA